ncbi:hypothetical protein J8273_3621 [Carpediemonas membranifera]|uniref:Uncharacterized protein n=1 Tax=Carpediemonas membranifera TaxID=201153 RepID=A0A8J6ASN1_9EUKA|nr:hypothetical protein J8273_3621 [Carpediemonas membranifera]|eukprot:KAG9393481.1 hypothetical protein J8273_3621 [Carpediemonas membranifera]
MSAVVGSWFASRITALPEQGTGLATGEAGREGSPPGGFMPTFPSDFLRPISATNTKFPQQAMGRGNDVDEAGTELTKLGKRLATTEEWQKVRRAADSILAKCNNTTVIFSRDNAANFKVSSPPPARSLLFELVASTFKAAGHQSLTGPGIRTRFGQQSAAWLLKAGGQATAGSAKAPGADRAHNNVNNKWAALGRAWEDAPAVKPWEGGMFSAIAVYSRTDGETRPVLVSRTPTDSALNIAGDELARSEAEDLVLRWTVPGFKELWAAWDTTTRPMPAPEFIHPDLCDASTLVSRIANIWMADQGTKLLVTESTGDGPPKGNEQTDNPPHEGNPVTPHRIMAEQVQVIARPTAAQGRTHPPGGNLGVAPHNGGDPTTGQPNMGDPVAPSFIGGEAGWNPTSGGNPATMPSGESAGSETGGTQDGPRPNADDSARRVPGSDSDVNPPRGRELSANSRLPPSCPLTNPQGKRMLIGCIDFEASKPASKAGDEAVICEGAVIVFDPANGNIVASLHGMLGEDIRVADLDQALMSSRILHGCPPATFCKVR